jgi:tetratricopeptide (TPR) repeat protein
MDTHQIKNHPHRLNHRLSISLALAALVAMILLIYFPGLSGPYVLDDGENIANNEALAIEEISPTNLWRAMQSNDSGPFRRPLATLTFAFNYYLSGGFDNTFSFKLTNLVVHAANGVLLLFLTLTILRSSNAGRNISPMEQLGVAALTAALWSAHPIQLTNVLYVVQRMNSMSASFVILGLMLFVQGRHYIEVSAIKGLLLMGIGFFAGTFLGMGFKENAALLPLLALTIEFSFFRRENLDINTRLQLRSFYFVAIVLPVIVFLAYVLVNPEFLSDAYKIRQFSMAERLLTESRVLWNYIGLIALPNTHDLGLFHDDIQISKGLFTPPETFLALSGLTVMLAIAILKKKQIPMLSFAVLWFLAGHLLESSIFGLEIAYEHRNYLPAYGVLFAISYLYAWASRRWDTGLRFFVAVSIIVTLGFATWTRAHTWKDIYSIAETNATNHPESPRANELAARVNAFDKGNLPAAIRYTIQGLKIAPDEAGFHINLHLFLALLSSQIDQGMKSADLKHMKGADIHIAGLPSEVITITNNNHAQLVYPPSTINAVEKLLETRPITVHTLAALDALGRCIMEKPDICQQMTKQGLKWHVIAAGNLDTTKTYNALILNNTAELYAHMSDYTTAMVYIDRAIQTVPDVLFYRLKKAEYLVKQGRLDEAQALLAFIDKMGLKNDPRLFANSALVESVQNEYTGAIRTRHQPTLPSQGHLP